MRAVTQILITHPQPAPLPALEDAIAEMEKGKGNPKSIALIALSLAKYLKHDKAEKDALKAEIETLKMKVK